MSDPRFSRAEGIVHRWVDDKVLALRRDGTASTIEGLAAIVWEVTGTPRTTDQVEAATRDLAPGERRNDPAIRGLVVDAIATLTAAGLLVEQRSD